MKTTTIKIHYLLYLHSSNKRCGTIELYISIPHHDCLSSYRARDRMVFVSNSLSTNKKYFVLNLCARQKSVKHKHQTMYLQMIHYSYMIRIQRCRKTAIFYFYHCVVYRHVNRHNEIYVRDEEKRLICVYVIILDFHRCTSLQ